VALSVVTCCLKVRVTRLALCTTGDLATAR
jgi:hypothetical protein